MKKFLLVVLLLPCFGHTFLTGSEAWAVEPVKVIEAYDSYAKTNSISTDKFTVPDVGSFFDPAFAHAWLSAIFFRDHPPSIALHIYFSRANGWRFFDRAFDANGNALRVDVLARDVQFGSAVVEQFMTRLSLSYLQSRKEAGLDVRFDGKSGSLIVQLPAAYVQALLGRLDNTRNIPDTLAAVPKSIQKLRLGIRYVDEATALKLPEAFRSNVPKNGLLLIAVEPGSPASVAGFSVGDVLTEFGGIPVATVEDMTSAMERTKAGSQFEARVLRGGQTVTLTVSM